MQVIEKVIKSPMAPLRKDLIWIDTFNPLKPITKTFVDGAWRQSVEDDQYIYRLVEQLRNDVDTINNKVGSPDGIAELDNNGKIPSEQLPSYVDDVLEFANYNSLPEVGEEGKIYVTLNDNLSYRWTGSTYIRINEVEIPENISAFRNDVGYLTEHQDISGKQDVIQDLETIRAGAALGATSIQEHQDISGKQDVISDLEDIRAGAALGATSIQEHQDISGKANNSDLLAHTQNGDIHVTAAQKSAWSGKQDAISDLEQIRSRADEGHTAYQKPVGGIPKTDLDSSVKASLDKADTALQEHQDISGKANKSEMLVTVNNDKTTITLKTGASAEVINRHQDISGKQDTINDLSDIRSGAAAGATAYQKPVNGIPASDIESGVIPDVSSFITKTVNDLTNYYLKSETYTKSEVQGLIGAIQQFHYEIAPSTASVQNPVSNALYLIGPTGSGADKYEEYVYTSNTWTKIGDTTIDLSDYVTTTVLSTALADYTTTANLTTLLAGKADASDLTAHTTNGDIHVTAAQKTAWTNKQDAIDDLSTIRSNAADGEIAYGWGNHASEGYLKSVPIASNNTAGIVKVGTNLSIDSNGILSATDTTYSNATTENAGLMSADDKTKLNGIESGAEVNEIETIKVNGNVQTITNKAVDITVPTKTSDLTNDDNVVKDASYVHTDNNYTTDEKNKLSGIETGAQANVIETIKINGTAQTVTNKAVNLPAYPTTLPASDVSAWAKKSSLDVNDIPSITTGKISDLETWISNKGYVTNAVDNLTNYYTKSTTYTKTEVDNLLGAINQFKFEIYASVSAVTNPQSNVLYLIGPTGALSDKYEEYVYTNSSWVKIGDTTVDLSGYVTKVSGATSGNFAGLDSSGNITDSGKKASDFATSSQGAKADTAYQKQSGGIPKTDLADAVQTSLGKADTALQEHQDISGKVDKVNGKDLSTNDFTDALKTKLDGIEGGAQVNDIEHIKIGSTEQTISEKTVSLPASYPKADIADIAVNNKTELKSNQEFKFRKTNCDWDAKTEVVKSIKGKTLAWNQLIDNSTSALQAFSTFHSTKSVSGNVLSFIGNDEYAQVFTNSNIQIAGHKYFVSADIKSTTSISFYIRIGNDEKLFSVSSQYNTLSGIFTAIDGGGLIFYDCRTSDWTTVDIKNIVEVDLTLLYGSAIDCMTDAQILAKYEADFGTGYYPYNTGELISNDAESIETVGFNQWDEEWENGVYDVANGQKRDLSGDKAYIRSKNYITVFHNTQYYAKALSCILAYDSNKNYISSLGWIVNSVFTTPSNCSYITFYIADQYGITYNHDICINISDPTKNGTYEPYRKSTMQLNLGSFQVKDSQGNVTTITGGLKSAGSAYDEIVGKKFVKRVGSVDMGTLTWDYSEELFYSTVIPDMVSKSRNPNGICSKYSISTEDYSHAPDKSLLLGDSSFSVTLNRLYIKDSFYSDPATLKTALSGVMLNYELATPIEYDLVELIPTLTTCSKHGTERVIYPESSTPSAPFKADIQYGSNNDDQTDNTNDVVTKYDSQISPVIASAFAKLQSEIDAMKRMITDYHIVAKAESIDSMEYKIGGIPHILYSTTGGAPSASNVPTNWNEETMQTWSGVPRFVGQIYVDQSSNKKVYFAVAVTNSTSDWIALN